jgi:hypothetical protein
MSRSDSDQLSGGSVLANPAKAALLRKAMNLTKAFATLGCLETVADFEAASEDPAAGLFLRRSASNSSSMASASRPSQSALRSPPMRLSSRKASLRSLGRKTRQRRPCVHCGTIINERVDV